MIFIDGISFRNPSRQEIHVDPLLDSLIVRCAAGNTRRRQLAPDAGWQRLNLDAGPCVLAAFVPPDLAQSNALTIYIEGDGDGLAWMLLRLHSTRSNIPAAPMPVPMHMVTMP